MKKYSAALYMRLSKEDGEKESESIISQRKILRSYAKEHGFSVYGEYEDDGFSGTNFDRPAFKRMISDIESGNVNAVLTKDLSRLGRDYILSGQYTEIYFPQKNVRYIAVNDGYDSACGESDIAPFKNVMNEMYARDISKKIRSALTFRMKEGAFVGANPPYGYKRDSSDRHKLVIDIGAHAVVKEIFSSAAGGASAGKIAEELNRRRVPSPLDYRQKNAPPLYRWSAATVRKIINNEAYLGITAQSKSEKPSFKSRRSVSKDKSEWIIVSDTHEPIVSKETADLARSKLKSRAFEKSGAFKNRFSGIIFCADCKRAMSAVKSRKKEGGMNLVCGGYKQKGKAFCSNHAIDYSALQSAVQSVLNEQLAFSREEREEIINSVKDMLFKEKPRKKAETQAVKKRIAELDLLTEKLFSGYAEGVISKERASALISKYEEEQRALFCKIKKAECAEESAELEAEIEKALREYTCADTENSDLLFSLVKKIEILSRDENPRSRKIRIFLNFKENPPEKA